MSALRMFIPIRKVDVAQRLVYGLATAETKDRAGEICDYASTRPLYEKWSEAISKSTHGKSLGNLRAMHGPVAAGKVTAISFNDEDKQIEICAKVVDDAEWAKVEEGVYTGFSQGGAYARRWTDADGLTRYTAEPTEISLVDLPCLPQSQFEMIKADGTVEQRRFVNDAAAGLLSGLSQEIDDVSVRESAERREPGTAKKLRDIIERASAMLRAMGVEETSEIKDEGSAAERSIGVREASEKAARPRKSGLAKMDPISTTRDHACAQQVHDMALELGAVCGAEKAMPSGLEKRFDALSASIGEMLQRIKHIEEQPLPLPLSGRARAISKHEDGSGDSQPGDAIEALLSDPHGLSVLAIKLAQRNGRPATR